MSVPVLGINFKASKTQSVKTNSSILRYDHLPLQDLQHGTQAEYPFPALVSTSILESALPIAYPEMFPISVREWWRIPDPMRHHDLAYQCKSTDIQRRDKSPFLKQNNKYYTHTIDDFGHFEVKIDYWRMNVLRAVYSSGEKNI